ncbi:MAG: hypothetical protein WBI07_09245 [Mobilitalea sp.]
MIIEGKVRNVTLVLAADVCLRRMAKSPYRCTRNLIELGMSAFPEKLSDQEQYDLSHELLTACKNKDAVQAKALFVSSFLEK